MARLSCYGYNMPTMAIQVHHRYNSLQLCRFLDMTVIYNQYKVCYNQYKSLLKKTRSSTS